MDVPDELQFPPPLLQSSLCRMSGQPPAVTKQLAKLTFEGPLLQKVTVQDEESGELMYKIETVPRRLEEEILGATKILKPESGQGTSFFQSLSPFATANVALGRPTASDSKEEPATNEVAEFKWHPYERIMTFGNKRITFDRCFPSMFFKDIGCEAHFVTVTDCDIKFRIHGTWGSIFPLKVILNLRLGAEPPLSP